ncbi:MAG: NAD(P)-binding protein [Dehalococcoidia bacterium]
MSTEKTIEVDYLVKGAGATGMAFVDTLLSETDATVAMVDRHDRPGGHWNDAYSFVRLHQPAASYGVNSRPLGTGVKDHVGLNKGYYELASGQEVLSHFDLTMNERFLPSGRVHYFPMSELADDGIATGLLSGKRTRIKAKKFVDGTYSKVNVPSVCKPRYAISPEATVVPVNDLPRAAGRFAEYVVIGSGKTGMDACIWLLQNGAEPNAIRWIMPRDYWLLPRKNFQPGMEFMLPLAQRLAAQAEVIATATTVDELFLNLERCGNVCRIDSNVTPTGYHCAVVSELELEELRRIRNVVRLGHVTRVDKDSVVLERGTIPAGPEVLHIDCSATGIPRLPSRPVFENERITLQFVRMCQPVFSAAFIAHVEAAFDDEAEKNRICAPQAIPDTPADFLEVLQIDLANRQCWGRYPELGDWMVESRLEGSRRLLRAIPEECPEALPYLQRYQATIGEAQANIRRLLGQV